MGALQLLRHARVPHAVHGCAGSGRRPRVRRRRRRLDLRHLHRQRLGRRRSSAASSPIGLLGQYRSVLIGGIIIALGHFTLAFKALPFFYAGLALIVVGTGLLKPNVSTLVGSLYAQGDARRDAGFSIFYMGINLGALSRAAGRRLPGAARRLAHRLRGGRGRDDARPRPVRRRPQTPRGCDAPSDRGRRPTRPASPTRGFTAAEWKRMGAIVIFFLVAILFWGAYEQAGSTLNLFADRYTRDRTLRLLVPLVLVPVGAAGRSSSCSRRSSRGSGCGSGAASLRCRRSRLRRPVHGAGVPASWCPRGAAAQSGAGVRVSPWWLIVSYFDLRARRTVPQPGRPQRGDQARAAAHRRLDDGRVVPVERVRQQARRLGGGLFQHDAAATAVRRGDASSCS